MTKKEAFKVGFATYMAEQGITPEAFDAMIREKASSHALVKQALETPTLGASLGTMAKGIGFLGGAGIAGIKNLAGMAWPAVKGLGTVGLYALPAAGALAGYTSTGANPVTKEDMKAMEDMSLINEYKNEIKKHGPKRKKQTGARPALTAEERTPEYQVHSAAPKLDLSKVAQYSKLANVVDNINAAKAKVGQKPVAGATSAQPVAPATHNVPGPVSNMHADNKAPNQIPAPRPVKL